MICPKPKHRRRLANAKAKEEIVEMLKLSVSRLGNGRLREARLVAKQNILVSAQGCGKFTFFIKKSFSSRRLESCLKKGNMWAGVGVRPGYLSLLE